MWARRLTLWIMPPWTSVLPRMMSVSSTDSSEPPRTKSSSTSTRTISLWRLGLFSLFLSLLMSSPATTTAYSNFSITDVNVLFQNEIETFPVDMVNTLYTQQPWTSGDPKRMTFDTFALPSFGERTDENDAAPEFEITEG